MHPIMRLLFVGTLLCIGLQAGGVRPVEADGELEPGKYSGPVFIFLELTSKKSHSAPMGSLKGSVYAGFTLEDRLNVEIVDSKSVLFTITGRPHFNIQQSADAQTTAGGKYCNWGEWMFGKAQFSTPVLTPLTGESASNYDPADKSSTMKLSWIKNTTWDKTEKNSSGTIPGCTENWGEGLQQAQMKGVEEMKKQIREITFTINNFDAQSIEGTCSLRGWEGKFKITGGEAERTVTFCEWQVFRRSEQEWESY